MGIHKNRQTAECLPHFFPCPVLQTANKQNVEMPGCGITDVWRRIAFSHRVQTSEIEEKQKKQTDMLQEYFFLETSLYTRYRRMDGQSDG